MESVLSEVMFFGPGSAIRFCLIDEAYVKSQLKSHTISHSHPHNTTEDTQMPRCWSRGQNRIFEEEYEKEEDKWRRKHEPERQGHDDVEGADGSTFERLRRVGSSGM